MRSIRQSTLNLCAAIILAMMLVLLALGAWSLRMSMEEASTAAVTEKETHILADQMREASDFLTDQVRAFSVTLERSGLDAYWNEVEVSRRREEAIARLSSIDTPESEVAFLVEAKAKSDLLMGPEILAQRLLAEALGFSEASLPLRVAACRLDPQDEGLPAARKVEKARYLVFGPEYMASKKAIIDDIEKFSLGSRERTGKATLEAQAHADRTFALVVGLCGFCVIVALCFFVLYYRQVAGPIQVYIRTLAGPLTGSSQDLPALQPQGTTELVTLAETLNRRREESQAFQAALRASEARMRTHLQMMPLGELDLDERNRVRSWNPAAERMFGWTEDEALGKDLVDLIVPDHAKDEVRAVIYGLNARDAIRTHTNVNIRKDGQEIVCEWNNTPIFNEAGSWQGWASIVKDITHEREEQEKILYLSRHDPLTGLLNRRYLVEKLEEARLRARRTGTIYSTIMADIDSFKGVNDSYGHECGDLALRTVATVMRDSLRATDYVGRWGGEEFLILLPETTAAGGFELGERVRQKIAEKVIEYQGRPIRITVTVGVAACRDGDEPIDDCVRRADEALLDGKAGGRNRTLVAD